ncbi:hypothetical protein [Streptomyces sp. WAC05858]|uniref:hypothetical protein n=1 Tax=Streptomyces TaxID=1883 RepID=UPI000F7B00B7|nr:hypothetical protein [Streptomyces sp. WAC05858]RSS47575.1 hypothetical protein EF902_08980 [Streptomyces sp. WAC05858]
MTSKAKTPGGNRASDEVLFSGGTEATVTPIARPVTVTTSGRVETAVRCPECSAWHRHIGIGLKTAPCGAIYRVEYKNQRRAA